MKGIIIANNDEEILYRNFTPKAEEYEIMRCVRSSLVLFDYYNQTDKVLQNKPPVDLSKSLVFYWGKLFERKDPILAYFLATSELNDVDDRLTC